MNARLMVRLLDVEVTDHRSPRAARLSLGRLRGRLRRVDGDEANKDLARVDDPEARGGIFRVVFVDILQVTETQNLLRQILEIRAVYPAPALAIVSVGKAGQLTSRQQT